jgi:uncharacterized protein
MTDTAIPQAASLPAPGICDPWKFWATSLWTGLAILVWLAVQLVVMIGLFAWFGVSDNASKAELEMIASHGVTVSLVAIAAVPAELAVIWLAVKRARCRFADYLALARPGRRDVLLGIACLVVLLPLADVVSYLAGRAIIPPFVAEMYRSARDSGTLPLLAVALVVAAPLAEELVFRGFVYRGLAASRVGVTGAIVISSAVWAAMHVQYEPFFMVHIFVIGLVFGYWRWRSGSTILTLILHAIVNACSLAQIAFMTEFMS